MDFDLVRLFLPVCYFTTPIKDVGIPDPSPLVGDILTPLEQGELKQSGDAFRIADFP